LSETMQLKRTHVVRVTHTADSCASRERNRAVAGEYLRRVIEKNFIDQARGERSPIDHRAAFNQNASDLQFSKTACNSRHIGTAVGHHWGNLLHSNPQRL